VTRPQSRGESGPVRRSALMSIIGSFLSSPLEVIYDHMAPMNVNLTRGMLPLAPS
jgi:hypothetical protein